MVDAIGKARRGHGDQQDRIGRLQRQGEEAHTANDKAGDEDAAGAEPVTGKAHRRLHEQRDQIEQGQGETDLEEASPEMARQERQQRRQGHDVDMADEVSRRYLRQQDALRSRHGRTGGSKVVTGRHEGLAMARRP